MALASHRELERTELPDTLPAPLPALQVGDDAPAGAVAGAQRLEIGDPGNPAITICRAPDSFVVPTAPIPVTDTLAENLAPLMQHAPGLAALAGQAAHTYVLTFAPDVAAGLADGSYRLVQRLGTGIRPIAADASTGQFVAHGWLQPTRVANPATLSLAVWQVMAYVTAQHFLYAIHDRLQAIEKSIAEVKEWLAIDYQATLQGGVGYIRDLRGRLLEGQLAESAIPVLAGRLEEIEREAVKIHLALKLHLSGHLAEISRRRFHGRSLAVVTDKAREYLREYERLGQTLLLALLSRSAAAQMSCAFLDRKLSARRIDGILGEAQAYSAFRTEFSATMTERIHGLSSWWPFERKRKKNRVALLADLEARSSRLDDLAAQLDATIAAALRQLKDESHDGSGAIALAVTLNKSGAIADVRRLLPASANGNGKEPPARRSARGLGRKLTGRKKRSKTPAA